ncbi:MAG TPA: dockerin type I domain-containing protein [Pirellulales bacterium]|nr:dockerin type I domain-containing protein [Pirellulales bacterium]
MALVVSGLTIATKPATADPFAYTGGTYSNNFDGLPTDANNATQTITGDGPVYFAGTVNGVSNLDGWQLANPGGSSGNIEFKSQNGSLANNVGRGVVSYGINGSTNRAIGTTATSNQINTFGMLLVNNTTTTFTQFTLSYTGEVWSIGDETPPDALVFAYGLPTDTNDIDSLLLSADSNLDFHGNNTSNYSTIKSTVPTGGSIAVDGTNATNQQNVSDTASGVSWAPGQVFAIRWFGQNNKGQDDGLGIDNLSLSFAVTTSILHGDMNFDGHVDSSDIVALEKALADPSGFVADNPDHGLTVSNLGNYADVTGNGIFNNADVQSLINLLLAGNGSITSVPEPSSVLLAGIAWISFGLLQLSKRANLS